MANRRSLVALVLVAVLATTGCPRISEQRAQAKEAELQAVVERIRVLEAENQKLREELTQAKEERDRWQREVDGRTMTIGQRDVEIMELRNRLKDGDERLRKLTDDLHEIRLILEKQAGRKTEGNP